MPPLDSTDYNGEYGDGYIVGDQAPFNLYVWSRTDEGGFWFDWGPLNAPSTIQGPPGDKGETGDQGTRGSNWNSGSGTPVEDNENVPGDCWLNTNRNSDGSPAEGCGDIYIFNGVGWVPAGNILGPRGPIGNDGPDGPQGAQGERGLKGDKGERGEFVYVQAVLDNEGQLPQDFTDVQRSDAYLVKNNGAEDLWLIVGQEDKTTWNWHNVGTVAGGESSGTKVTIDGVKQESVPLDYVPKISINYQIGDSTNVSSNGSEVTFSSLQTSGQNVTNEDITGLGVIELPIANSQEIEIDQSAQPSTLQFKLSDNVWNRVQTQIDDTAPVEIAVTTTGTAFNLDTTTQVPVLLNNSGAYLKINQEIFRLQDNQNEAGYLVYSHVGFENNTSKYMVKCATITISTGGTVITTREIIDPSLVRGKVYICNSTSTSNNKIVSVPELQDVSTIPEGYSLRVYFTNANSVTTPLLYISPGNSAATAIWEDNYNTGICWKANSLMELVYYSGHWNIVSGYSLHGMPIGYIYQSLSNTSPATRFGGTWTSIAGRYLVGYVSTPTSLPNYRSSYSSSTIYQSGEIVLYSSTYYISLIDHNVGNTPSTNASAWKAYNYNIEFGKTKSHSAKGNFRPNVSVEGSVVYLGNDSENGGMIGQKAITGTNIMDRPSGTTWATTTTVGMYGDLEDDGNYPPSLTVYMWRRTA